MKHLGDITKIDGAKVPKVDIITFGAPCTDLSVAGLRLGMKSRLNGDEEETRSGLFFDAIRVIKEMREDDRRTNGRTGINIRPRFAVYENVTGAYSSNNGKDFQAVLQEICKVVCKDVPPIPIPKEGWHYAGNLDGVGDDGTPFSVSWRLHNSQYWGVPQRRRRVCVVADFGGNTASKLLFELWGKAEQSNPDIPIADIRNESKPEVQSERQGLSRNTEESGNEGKGITGTSENNIGETISFQERAGCDGGVKESSFSKSEQEHCQLLTTKQSYQEPTCYRGDSITSVINQSQPEAGLCHTLSTDSRNYLVNTPTYSQDAYDKFTETDKSATIKQSGGSYGGGSEALVISGNCGKSLLE